MVDGESLKMPTFPEPVFSERLSIGFDIDHNLVALLKRRTPPWHQELEDANGKIEDTSAVDYFAHLPGMVFKDGKPDPNLTPSAIDLNNKKDLTCVLVRGRLKEIVQGMKRAANKKGIPDWETYKTAVVIAFPKGGTELIEEIERDLDK